jgi:hypothetical protein
MSRAGGLEDVLSTAAHSVVDRLTPRAIVTSSLLARLLASTTAAQSAFSVKGEG